MFGIAAVGFFVHLLRIYCSKRQSYCVVNNGVDVVPLGFMFVADGSVNIKASRVQSR